MRKEKELGRAGSVGRTFHSGFGVNPFLPGNGLYRQVDIGDGGWYVFGNL